MSLKIWHTCLRAFSLHRSPMHKKPMRTHFFRKHASGVALMVLLACASHGVSAAQSAGASTPEPNVGVFKPGSGAVPEPWSLIQLDKKVAATRYRLEVWDGVPAIRADAKASMALMARPVSVDLQATPVLCWRWRVKGVVKSADMATKQGDDYAARVYVAFNLPDSALSFGTRAKLGIARAIYGDQVPDAAVNYVWDNTHPVGTRAPNAYTDRAHMIVRRSGDQQANQWVDERANILQDVQRAFGSAEARVTILAVASDTDNTGEVAEAGFADLHFVSADKPCR